MIQYLPVPAHVRRRRLISGGIFLAICAGLAAGLIAYLMGA